jgi:hypothetical protein
MYLKGRVKGFIDEEDMSKFRVMVNKIMANLDLVILSSDKKCILTYNNRDLQRRYTTSEARTIESVYEQVERRLNNRLDKLAK